MGTEKTISALQRKVEKFRDERDWLRFHSPKDLSIALSIESSELEELFLWKDKTEIERLLKDENKVKRAEEELADIAIYLLSLSSVLRINLGEAIESKLALNARKYPVNKSKGSSKKYNEL